MLIPDNLKPIFWDTNPNELDIETHKPFIIARVAEKGRWADVQWLRQIYPDSDIAEVVLRSNNTSPKVKSFWKAIANGDEKASDLSPVYFITGNANKFAEVKSMLPKVEQLDIDLPEIQEIDAKEIIKAKLEAAYQHAEGEFIVEDTSLYLDGLGGLPGPLIKWFLKTIGNDGLVKLSQSFGNDGAEAKTIIGYARNRDEIYFFEGIVKGKIVEARGKLGFGWDPIFLPDGHSKTFAEMEGEEKNLVSMRRIAVNKLADFLAGSRDVIES